MPKQGKHELLMQEILHLWNEKAKENGWCRCRSLNPERKRHLRARLDKDPDWYDMAKEALEKLPDSSFHKGKNKNGWKANFDWFIRPRAVARFLEQHEVSAGDDDFDLAQWD